MLIALCGDDAFDYDMGYQGKGQFWCAIQSPASGDRLIEADGNSYGNPEATPYSNPVVYNATLIGKRGIQAHRPSALAPMPPVNFTTASL